jgi:hypothetical protein
MDQVSESTPIEHQVRELYRDCELAVAERRWDDALGGFERLLRVLETAGDAAGGGRAHLRMACACEQAGRLDDARRHAACAEDRARAAGDRGLLAAALHRRGHLLRMNDPAAARELFCQSLAADQDDPAARGITLAMIGQIDFTEGDRPAGLDTMLQALAGLPPTADAFEHLLEHIAYFGSKLPRADYVRLVTRRIVAADLRDRLL